MKELFQNVLTASFHGSIVILAVVLLRLVLKRTPRNFFRFLWLLAFARLLMPFEIQSALSLQPRASAVAEQRWVQQGDPALPEPFAVSFPEPETDAPEKPYPEASSPAVPTGSSPAPVL